MQERGHPSMTQSRRRSVSLSELRQAKATTQVAVADSLDMSQGEVSRLERRGDMYVSSLARYIEALGGRLELRARFPNGRVYTVTLIRRPQ
jgi:Helix-turn-helix domain